MNMSLQFDADLKASFFLFKNKTFATKHCLWYSLRNCAENWVAFWFILCSLMTVSSPRMHSSPLSNMSSYWLENCVQYWTAIMHRADDLYVCTFDLLSCSLWQGTLVVVMWCAFEWLGRKLCKNNETLRLTSIPLQRAQNIPWEKKDR